MKTKPLFVVALALFIGSALSAQSVEFDTWGKGIKFVSKDSNSTIKASARIQNLMILTSETGEVPTFNGLTRRARLKFDGQAFSPRIKYKIELGLSNRDTKFTSDAQLVGATSRIILDAVVKYNLFKGTDLWFGQTKLPGNRERVISSQKLQFVDRSNVNSKFNIDRDFGFQLRHKYMLGESIIKLAEAISLGEGRNVINTNSGGFDYTGRIEFLPMGEFEGKGDYFGSDLKREESPKLSIGVTGDFNQGAVRQGGQLGKLMVDSTGAFVESDLTSILADMMFKYQGVSFMAEVAYKESSRGNYTDFNGNAFRQGFGYNGQLGYLFKSNYEIAGRYTRIMPLSGMVSAIDHTEQFTLGVSKYFKGHNLKVQTDLTYERALTTIFANEKLIFRLQTELAF